MIYATRPGYTALVSAKMTFKLVAHMEDCLNEKGMILFPDDISYFDHPDQICEVNPRITFKIAMAKENFEYKDEKLLIDENKQLREELELMKVSLKNKILLVTVLDKIQRT